MSNRPNWCPADVWQVAVRNLGVPEEDNGWHSTPDMIETLARAILAERERCIAAITSMAIPHYMALGTVNGARRKIDPTLPNVEFTYPETPTARFVLLDPPV